MVVDSSAIVAIILEEADARRLLECLKVTSAPVISVANYVECGQVLASRSKSARNVALDEFHEFLRISEIELAPIDEAQARLALDARIRYGRGFGHPARLNYSDCFAYALAKARNLPLLFIGDDFTHTDIVSALA